MSIEEREFDGALNGNSCSNRQQISSQGLEWKMTAMVLMVSESVMFLSSEIGRCVGWIEDRVQASSHRRPPM